MKAIKRILTIVEYVLRVVAGVAGAIVGLLGPIYVFERLAGLGGASFALNPFLQVVLILFGLWLGLCLVSFGALLGWHFVATIFRSFAGFFLSKLSIEKSIGNPLKRLFILVFARMNSCNPLFVHSISEQQRLIVLTVFWGTCLVQGNSIQAFFWGLPIGDLQITHHQNGETLAIFEYNINTVSPSGFITKEYVLFVTEGHKIIRKVLRQISYDDLSPRFTVKDGKVQATVKNFNRPQDNFYLDPTTHELVEL